VKNGLGVVVHRQLNTYADSVNGRVLLQRIEGISPSTTSTTYTYVSGRIASEVVSGGWATTYTSNSEGREVRRHIPRLVVSPRRAMQASPILMEIGIDEALDTTLEKNRPARDPPILTNCVTPEFRPLAELAPSAFISSRPLAQAFLRRDATGSWRNGAKRNSLGAICRENGSTADARRSFLSITSYSRSPGALRYHLRGRCSRCGERR